MNQTIDPCEHMKMNLIAAAVGLQQCTKTAANLVPLPDGRVVVIGAPAEAAALLATQAQAAAPATDERAAFEAWHRSKFATKHSTGQPTRDMHNGVYAEKYGPENQQLMWEAFQAGAALAHPAAAAPAIDKNQCDGCRQGTAINDCGNHIDDAGRPFMSCTRHLYAHPAAEDAATSELPVEPTRLSIDESKQYLIDFMERHFKDKTFHRYIRGGLDRATLAGDFAWELARALRMIAAPTEAKGAARDAAGAWREGALMAASTLVSVHDVPTMAASILGELGLRDADCSALDEFDKANLQKIQEADRSMNLRGLGQTFTTTGARHE